MPARNLYPPSNLATSSTAPPVALSWSRGLTAVSYKVYRDGAVIGTPTALSFSDAGVQRNSRHKYMVTSIDGAGNESDGTVLDVSIEPAGQLTFQVVWTPQPGHLGPPQPRWNWQ